MKKVDKCTSYIGRPPGVQEVMGSTPVGDLDFALSHGRIISINSLFTSYC